MQVFEALYAAVHPTAALHYKAFFSSELGGITTDPALMFVHIDDHMLHRCFFKYILSITKPDPEQGSFIHVH